MRFFSITLGMALLASVGNGVRAADVYELGPDSLQRRPGVPRGTVEPFVFEESEIFAETRRAGWVYLPAQLERDKPVALIVFQDGHAYVSEDGQIRAPIVFDNLIARGEIPVMVGIFVNPGHRGDDGPPSDGWGNRSNRSHEYDTLSDAYVRFLTEELLPFVAKTHELTFSDDPRDRAICGMSSGGICAWTAAWENPEAFGRVLSHIGSFTNIRGGHVYPALIRKSDLKPIRVFLQDGANDLNNAHGSWPLGNEQMAAALAFAGYDFRFVYGDGGHNGKHGGAIFDDSLRWLWRPDIDAKASPEEEVLRELSLGDWELVGEGYGFTDAACVDESGSFYFSDLPNGAIHRVGPNDSHALPWLENGPRISGLAAGPNGLLYAASQGWGEDESKNILVIDMASQQIETVASGVRPNDLVVTDDDWIYVTDTSDGTVVRVPATARDFSRPPPVAGGIVKPNGIALSPDGRTLWVSEHEGQKAWRFRLHPDGLLRGGERRLALRAPEDQAASGGDGMAVSASGHRFITSHKGIQVFDPEDRFLGILPNPQEGATVSCAIAGTLRRYLYVCSSDKVYRRLLNLPH